VSIRILTVAGAAVNPPEGRASRADAFEAHAFDVSRAVADAGGPRATRAHPNTNREEGEEGRGAPPEDAYFRANARVFEREGTWTPFEEYEAKLLGAADAHFEKKPETAAAAAARTREVANGDPIAGSRRDAVGGTVVGCVSRDAAGALVDRLREEAEGEAARASRADEEKNRRDAAGAPATLLAPSARFEEVRAELRALAEKGEGVVETVAALARECARRGGGDGGARAARRARGRRGGERAGRRRRRRRRRRRGGREPGVGAGAARRERRTRRRGVHRVRRRHRTRRRRRRRVGGEGVRGGGGVRWWRARHVERKKRGRFVSRWWRDAGAIAAVMRENDRLLGVGFGAPEAIQDSCKNNRRTAAADACFRDFFRDPTRHPSARCTFCMFFQSGFFDGRAAFFRRACHLHSHRAAGRAFLASVAFGRRVVAARTHPDAGPLSRRARCSPSAAPRAPSPRASELSAPLSWSEDAHRSRPPRPR
jgi:hypothetical protein